MADFARGSQPLTDLLREGQFEYPVPAAEQAAFVELRALLSQAPILKYFDPRDETELWTDASGTAIGGAVLQRDSRGNLRPVAYYSRRLSPSEEVLDIPARTSGHSGLPARVPVLLGGPPFRV